MQSTDSTSLVDLTTIFGRKIKKANRMVVLPQWTASQSATRTSISNFPQSISRQSPPLSSIDWQPNKIDERPIRPISVQNSPDKRLCERQLVRKVASIPSIAPHMKSKSTETRRQSSSKSAGGRNRNKENNRLAAVGNVRSPTAGSTKRPMESQQSSRRTPEPADDRYTAPEASLPNDSRLPAHKKHRSLSSLSHSRPIKAKTPEPALPPSPPPLPSPPSYLPKRSAQEIHEYIRLRNEQRRQQQVVKSKSKQSESQKIRQSLKSLDGFRRSQRQIIQQRKQKQQQEKVEIRQKATAQLHSEEDGANESGGLCRKSLTEEQLPGEESIDRLIDEAHALFNKRSSGNEELYAVIQPKTGLLTSENQQSGSMQSMPSSAGGLQRVERLLEAAQKLRDRVDALSGRPNTQLQSLVGFLDAMTAQVCNVAFHTPTPGLDSQSAADIAVLPPDQIPLEPELNAQSAPLETFNPAFDSTLSQTAAEPPAANRSTDSPFLPSESDISAAAPRLERVQMDKVHPNETQSSRVVTEEPALRRDLPKFAIPGDEMGVLNVLERRWGDLKVQPVNNRPRQLPLPITADDRSSILMPKQQIFDGLYNSNLAFATSKTHPENNAGDTHHLNAATTQFKPTHSEIKIGNYRMDGNEGEDHSSTASVSSAPLSASIGGTSSLKDRAALLTPEESDKLTPAVLGNKISQALDAFDSIQESRIRLEDLEKSRQLMIAQQETVALAKILEERQKKFELDLSLAKEQKQASIISDGAGAKPVALKPQSLIPQEAPTAPQLNKMDLSLNELSDPDPNGFSLNTIEEMLSKEKSRVKQHELLLTLREKTMEEQVRSEIAYLRQQRYNGKDGIVGAFDEKGNLNRDLECAIMMRLAAEKAEIQRLKRLNREKSVQRQKKLIKAQIEAIHSQPQRPITRLVQSESTKQFKSDYVMSKGNNNSIPQEINQQQIHTGDESIPEEIDKSSDKYTSIPESIAGSTDHSLNVAPISESDHQSVSNHGSVDDLSMRDLMKKLTDLREKNEIQRLQQRQNKIDLTKSMARELLSKRQKKLDWERKMKAEVEKINRVLDKALATDASLSSISLLSEGEQQIIGVDVQHTKCDSVSSNGQSLLPDVKQVLASDRSDKPAVPTDDDTSAGEISEGIPAIDDNNIIEEQIDISVQSASRDSSSIREELEGGSARTAASSISEQIEPLAIQKSTSSLVKIPSTSSSAGLSDSQLALTFAELSGSAADMINRIKELQQSVEDARQRANDLASEKSRKQDLLKEKLKYREQALRQELENIQRQSSEQFLPSSNKGSAVDLAVENALDEIAKISAIVEPKIPNVQVTRDVQLHELEKPEILSTIYGQSQSSAISSAKFIQSKPVKIKDEWSVADVSIPDAEQKDESASSDSIVESIDEEKITEKVEDIEFHHGQQSIDQNLIAGQSTLEKTPVDARITDTVDESNTQMSANPSNILPDNQMPAEKETIAFSNEEIEEILEMNSPRLNGEEPPATPTASSSTQLLDAVDLNLLTEQLADAYLDQTLSNTLEIIFRQQVELIRPPSPEKEQEDRSFFVEEGVPVFDQNSLERALEILLKAIPDNQQFRDPPFLPEEAFDALLRQPYISQQQRIAYRALFDAANEAMLGLFPDFADQQNPSYWLKENRSLRLRPIGTAELRSSITDKLLKWTDYGRKENGNLDKMLAEEIKEDERKWLDFDFERIEAEQLVALMIIEEMFNGEMDRLLTTPI